MARYRVRLQGHIDRRWLSAFDGLVVTYDPAGETVIDGELDQAGLHGLPGRIRDLGVALLSVERVEASAGGCGGHDGPAGRG